jgi:2'-5' RNA ligase
LQERLGAVRDAFRGLEGDRQQGLRWVAPQNLHVTLKFLGEVGDAGARRVGAALDSCRASVACFPCRVAGLGAFPSASSVRVLWAGIDVGREEMGLLARAIENALSALGFEREHRGFMAHITLARARDRAIAAPLESFGSGPSARVFGEFQVKGFSLMKSDLRPQGPVYSEVATYPLSPAQK